MHEGGYFREHKSGLWLPNEYKNTWVSDGAKLALRLLFRAEAVVTGTFYLGLTNANYTFDAATLAALAAGEPVGNGYARQALVRNTVDWTVQEVNGVVQALSKIVTFTCVGANWTQNWVRMFLCDAAAGTVGTVYAVSGPAPAPRTVTPGAAPSVDYVFWLRG